MEKLLVAYDITGNKRRRRLEKCLRGYGFRVQKSVFEVSVDKRESLKMIGEIKKEILPTEDSVRVYRNIRKEDVLSFGVSTSQTVPEIIIF